MYVSVIVLTSHYHAVRFEIKVNSKSHKTMIYRELSSGSTVYSSW